MKIAVTGAGGQLGYELCQQLGLAALPLDREKVDLGNRDALFQLICAERPDAVINAGAYTAVDRAEQEPDAARLINELAVGTLANACRELDIPLLQVSTDYVFGDHYDQRVPHREDEPVLAQGVYAQTKLAGERRAAQWSKHFIVRTCGLYGRTAPGKKPNNFVETMLRLGAERDSLKIVDDQYCTPSYVPHLARAILFLIGTKNYGTYHVVNTGSTNWFGFAQEIFRLSNNPIRLEPITSAQYAAALKTPPSPRPSYSVLDTAKYHALHGPPMPSWQAALAEYLAARQST